MLTHLLHFKLPLQPVLTLLVGDTCIFARHIIEPALIRLDYFPLGESRSKIQPVQRVTYRAHLVTHMGQRELMHLLPQHVVGTQVEKMLGDSIRIADIYQEPVTFVDYLQRYTAGSGGNNWPTLMNSFGNLDFEPLAGRKLKSHFGFGHECVEDLVRWAKADDTDLVGEVGNRVLNISDGQVVNDRAIRVIDGAVATDQELGDGLIRAIVLHALVEFLVGLDDVWDAFGWVEACNLDNVLVFYR